MAIPMLIALIELLMDIFVRACINFSHMYKVYQTFRKGKHKMLDRYVAIQAHAPLAISLYMSSWVVGKDFRDGVVQANILLVLSYASITPFLEIKFKHSLWICTCLLFSPFLIKPIRYTDTQA